MNADEFVKGTRATADCPTCHQPVPQKCDRCGNPAERRWPMKHKNWPDNVRWHWCDACHGLWLQVREFDEFEQSVAFAPDYPRAGRRPMPETCARCNTLLSSEPHFFPPLTSDLPVIYGEREKVCARCCRELGGCES